MPEWHSDSANLGSNPSLPARCLKLNTKLCLPKANISPTSCDIIKIEVCIMSLIEKTFSWFYYIRILIAPFLLGLLVGAILLIFVFKANTSGWVFGSLSVLFGLGYGIYLAEFARRNMGTINFMGINMHNKEFDNTDMMKTNKK